jgi:hypothetical protein
MKTQFDQMKEVLGEATFKGVASFIAVTNFSDKGKCLKKSRVANAQGIKVPTPNAVKNAKKYVFIRVNMGHNYEQLVNGRKKKEGQDKDFVSHSTYTHAVTENGMLHKHNDKDQYYVRVYQNVAPDFAPRSVVVTGDGEVMATSEFNEKYADFLPKKSANKSQGLKEENQIVVNNYKLENVQYIKRGELEYSNLSVEAFRTLFVDYKIQDKQA